MGADFRGEMVGPYKVYLYTRVLIPPAGLGCPVPRGDARGGAKKNQARIMCITRAWRREREIVAASPPCGGDAGFSHSKQGLLIEQPELGREREYRTMPSPPNDGIGSSHSKQKVQPRSLGGRESSAAGLPC